MNTLSRKFLEFINSQKFSGILLMIMTCISLVVANSGWAEGYLHFWEKEFGISIGEIHIGLSPEHFINEILMSVFFLLVGLEIKREFIDGELAGRERALMPIAAALGGMIAPALIYTLFNYGKPGSSGWGIPMATDIAFAIGILSILGKRVPDGLKVLLTALAVVDDLGAVMVIAIFYTGTLSFKYLLLAAGIMALLFILNKMKVHILLPYLLLGVILWFAIYKSGVHSTISGVLLALTIPYKRNPRNLLYKLEDSLHTPVNYFIMPLFALANTAIALSGDISTAILSSVSFGIAFGLIIGKPLGISLFIWIMVKLKWSRLPDNINMKEIIATGFLGGIGFTMSIFIALLAFDDPETIVTAKLMILISSLIAGTIGFLLLKKYADAKS